jgi:hypothetical protein
VKDGKIELLVSGLGRRRVPYVPVLVDLGRTGMIKNLGLIQLKQVIEQDIK